MAPRQGDKKIEIKKPKLLLVEGADALHFFIWALQAYGVDDIQVMDFGGITQLQSYLKMLSALPGYEMVKTIVIVRDAEKKPSTAIGSIQKALKETGLSVPPKPFSFYHEMPRVAFMLLPGLDSANKATAGTLENLCIDILKDTDVARLDCVQVYLDCLKRKGKEVKWRHKSFLHAYFAGEERFVGMKIGEASRAGAWNWDHELLQPFKDILLAM